jgi:hypothetical protein
MNLIDSSNPTRNGSNYQIGSGNGKLTVMHVVVEQLLIVFYTLLPVYSRNILQLYWLLQDELHGSSSR